MDYGYPLGLASLQRFPHYTSCGCMQRIILDLGNRNSKELDLDAWREEYNTNRAPAV